MAYTTNEEVWSYKNWSLIQREDNSALEDLRNELEEEWLKWDELEEGLKEAAWWQDIIILEFEENWDYRDWKCNQEEAANEYQKELWNI